jgi:hypothetical protein
VTISDHKETYFRGCAADYSFYFEHPTLPKPMRIPSARSVHGNGLARILLLVSSATAVPLLAPVIVYGYDFNPVTEAFGDATSVGGQILTQNRWFGSEELIHNPAQLPGTSFGLPRSGLYVAQRLGKPVSTDEMREIISTVELCGRPSELYGSNSTVHRCVRCLLRTGFNHRELTKSEFDQLWYEAKSGGRIGGGIRMYVNSDDVPRIALAEVWGGPNASVLGRGVSCAPPSNLAGFSESYWKQLGGR